MFEKIQKIKQRIGPLWWYSAILFFVLRIGDVVNAFIGLWLVPRYVPQTELGAVLPLTQVGSVLGLPLAIILVPFTKYLNTYATRGELGKVKCLLRDMFILTAFIFIFIFLLARFFLPLIFERMRVGEGSLGLLIVMVGVAGVLCQVFNNALQALKKFRAISVINFLSSPFRLVTMLVFMPFRALSGYFVGQAAPSAFLVAVSLFCLRKELGPHIRSESYWEKEWRAMLRYTLPIALVLTFGAIQACVESFVIRHRLPDIDSAGFYVISRFAEIGGYVGLTLTFVLFPLVSERHERGEHTQHLLWQPLVASVGLGFLFVGALHFAGHWILGLVPSWREYQCYAPQMTLLTVVYVLRTGISCFSNYEMACGRFAFVPYLVVVSGVECVLLYGLTGVSYFSGFLPDR